MKMIRFSTMASVLVLATAASVSAPTATLADQVFYDDVIIVASLCVGQDCVNGESFGFDTLRLKENNLRVHFQDTSNSASFPTNDWRIVVNDSTNGGSNYWAIEDSNAGRQVFRLTAGAPVNSLVVDAQGEVGLGTLTPVVELHVVDGDTPTLRLEQDGSNGFTPQTWDIAGNESNFFVRDATNGSLLPFKIVPSAPTNSLYVSADGDVGLGTSSPDTQLHLRGSGAVVARFEDVATSTEWEVGATSNTTLKISEANTPGVQFRFTTEGMLNIGAVATPPVLNLDLGSIYTDTTGALCFYDGTTWHVAAGAGTCT
jgi:hypothetical protein